MENKTIEEWLLGLPPGYSNRALENAKNHPRYDVTGKTNAMADAINRAFSWAKTPEGDQFWNKIFMAYSDVEYMGDGKEVNTSKFPPLPAEKPTKAKK